MTYFTSKKLGVVSNCGPSQQKRNSSFMVCFCVVMYDVCIMAHVRMCECQYCTIITRQAYSVIFNLTGDHERKSQFVV